MLFPSTVFLFRFLPILFIVYFIAPKKLKNAVLLVASLFFYAWGEPRYVLLMVFSILLNYVSGILIDKLQAKRMILIASVVANLSILVFYKYIGFILQSLIYFIPSIAGAAITEELMSIPLPIGISFFTFQAMSYVIDVYRKEVSAQKNIFNLALYVSLFPQLIAGPIVRYIDVHHEIQNRSITLPLFFAGVKRFIMGLGKKVLIANNMALLADQIFALAPQQLFAGISWLGLICYTLQIYFDFSGYSDMAIGLGKMFGFNFLENFNYPYISTSIKEFWRRWHISLSTWFRDYLYIPLGGNRKGVARTYINLLIVFVLCGFWHGASWNFLIWGAYHGAFLILERLQVFNTVFNKIPVFLKHIYALFVVMIGWVFFRAETLGDALFYLQSLFTFSSAGSIYYATEFFTHEAWVAFLFGLVCATPVLMKSFSKISAVKIRFSSRTVLVGTYIESIVLGILLLLCVMSIAAGTYNPFIYFRF